MGDVLKKVPVREQEPQVRAKNFDEVCLGYNAEEAVEEPLPYLQECKMCSGMSCKYRYSGIYQRSEDRQLC